MTCYECLKPASDLSPRSRCAECEWRRAIVNEDENSKLRHDYARLLQRYEDHALAGNKMDNNILNTD